MSKLIGIQAPEGDDDGEKVPTIDPERLEKVFSVAKRLNSKHQIQTVWLDDVLEWGLLTSKHVITPQGMQCFDTINFLDSFTVKQHVDMIRSAFSDVEKEQAVLTQKANKTTIIMTGGNA